MKEIVYYLLSLMLSYCTISSNSILFVVSDPRFSSVHQFHRVPFAEDKKIVLDTKLLQISGTQCPYNASIVKENNGYIISFREDLKPEKGKKGVTLSWVKLDQNFQQVEMSRFFNTKHIGAEDGRLFYCQEKLFLLYTYPIVNKSINRLFIPPDHYYSTPANMRQALVNIDQEGNIFNTTELRYGNQRIEKNWTPFEYKDENGHSHLYFIYKFNPREIICLTKSGKMEQVIPAAPHSRILWNLWEKCWGEIRGGTPALLIDGKYLTFFHSFFLDNEKRFYIFGALIFENKPPF